jgi:hypothetical protein
MSNKGDERKKPANTLAFFIKPHPNHAARGCDVSTQERDGRDEGGTGG